MTIDDRSPARTVLDRMERARRGAVGLLAAAAVVEVVCLVTFVLLLDFGDRLHQILLVMACLIYGTLGLGLAALAAYARMWNLRLLKALELLDEGRSRA